jgi:hypothetical protein
VPTKEIAFPKLTLVGKTKALNGMIQCHKNTHCSVKLEAKKLLLCAITALPAAYMNIFVRKVSILFRVYKN